MKKTIINQINNLTRKLIETNIVLNQNFPKWNSDYEIVWDNYYNLAFSLKDRTYAEIFTACVEKKDYNFLMIDGALIQMRYTCDDDEIKKHILQYLPSPITENYFESSEDFEENYFGTIPFSEMNNNSIIKFPLRFDFSTDTKQFIEFDHPYSHLTLGNADDCRIPVGRAILPNVFLHFILRSFYFKLFKERLTNNDFNKNVNLPETITPNEKQFLHLNYLLK